MTITMEDLEKINFPYYYNLVKEGKMKRKEAVDLLFGKKSNSYNKYGRYKRFLEGKQTTPQKTLDRKKEYYEANKDKIKDYKKENYEANKETILNRQKKRRQTPEGKAVQKRAIHKRRAKKKGNGGKYTADGWNQCLDYFNHCDAYTGEPLESTEIEHVIPISKGGTTYIYNLVPANGPTNRSKGKKDLWEWYSKQPYFSWDRYLKICMWIIKNGGASKDINIKE